MRHHNHNRKLGKETGGRNALLRGLTVSLVRDGSIITTLAKAKEMRPYIEKLVTRAKKGELADERRICAQLGSSISAKKLVKIIAPIMKSRPGGYTRITKLSVRESEQARMAVISFLA